MTFPIVSKAFSPFLSVALEQSRPLYTSSVTPLIFRRLATLFNAFLIFCPIHVTIVPERGFFVCSSFLLHSIHSASCQMLVRLSCHHSPGAARPSRVLRPRLLVVSVHQFAPPGRSRLLYPLRRVSILRSAALVIMPVSPFIIMLSTVPIILDRLSTFNLIRLLASHVAHSSVHVILVLCYQNRSIARRVRVLRTLKPGVMLTLNDVTLRHLCFFSISFCFLTLFSSVCTVMPIPSWFYFGDFCTRPVAFT